MVILHMHFDDKKEKQQYKHCVNRGILLRDGNILLVYNKAIDKYVIPGGGLEKGETCSDCCIREFQEETGLVVAEKELLIRICEYFNKEKFENNYFIVEYVRESYQNLTESEINNGLEPVWVPFDEAIEMFSNYIDFVDSDQIKCGTYRREHAALSYFKSYILAIKK